MTLIGAILAFIFLDGLARYALIGALAIFEVFEIAVFLRWRKKKATTGAEALVGARGEVVTACRPEGQVRLRGQLWKASCRVGADVGDTVVVSAVRGIALEVVPVNSSESSTATVSSFSPQRGKNQEN